MIRRTAVLILATACLPGVAAADDTAPPETSHDGLVRRESKAADLVYIRPGVDFSRYQRVAILDCPVAFRKDWQRDQAASGKRITQKDMDEIRKGLGAEFLKVFTDELQDKGGYSVVTTGGEDLLVLRPAIIDLDVTAPDTLSAGRSYTLSESAGAMTLYLELYDSVTGQILARAVDRQASRGIGRIQWQNSVTNRNEADKVLRRWARALREQLDQVHGKDES